MIRPVCVHSKDVTGHDRPDQQVVALRALSQGEHRTISYQVVCEQCRQQLQAQGLVLSGFSAQQDWLVWGRGNDSQALAPLAA